MYNIKLIEYPNGFAQIRLYSEPVGAEHNETGHVKYMTKDCQKLAHGAHRYYAIKNFPKPNISLMLLLDDEKEAAIQTAADSLGLDIVYRSETKDDYVQVEYIELQ